MYIIWCLNDILMIKIILCFPPPFIMQPNSLKDECFGVPQCDWANTRRKYRKKNNFKKKIETVGLKCHCTAKAIRLRTLNCTVKDESFVAYLLVPSSGMWAGWVSLACVCLPVGSSLLWCRCNVWQFIFKPTQEFWYQGQAQRKSKKKICCLSYCSKA